jgi:hypothetical protein
MKTRHAAMFQTSILHLPFPFLLLSLLKSCTLTAGTPHHLNRDLENLRVAKLAEKSPVFHRSNGSLPRCQHVTGLLSVTNQRHPPPPRPPHTHIHARAHARTCSFTSVLTLFCHLHVGLANDHLPGPLLRCGEQDGRPGRCPSILRHNNTP